MAWVRIDDQFPDHPKVMAAGPLASWLYVCGLAYCNRLLTDGFIPHAQINKLADVSNAGKLAATLVKAGLWDTVEGGYQVHDYLEYQPSRATVEAERQATAKRVADWRARNGKSTPGVTAAKQESNPVSNAVTSPVSNAVTNGLVTPAPHPTRSQSDLNSIEDLTYTSGASAEGVPEPPPVVDNFTPWWEALWSAYPARRGKKLHKGDARALASKIPARDWDRVTAAVQNYAASDQGRKGIVEDMHRFLRHWLDWETPETETSTALAVIGGTNARRSTASEREAGKLDDLAAWLQSA